jgi:diguanylate cyclase (GGDEF)-like protein/PAS domain S-box-containing protein
MRTTPFATWLTRGTYPRLYLPIIAIMLIVLAVRYHLLIEAEVKEVKVRQQEQLSHMEHYLAPTLQQWGLTSETAQIQQKLEIEAGFNPDISNIRWEYEGISVSVQPRHLQASPVPGWFGNLTGLRSEQKSWHIRMTDGTFGVLVAQLGAEHAKAQVWETVRTQIPISAINVFTIFFLLTLLLRANARMLSRLRNATSAFRAGQLHMRMVERGTLEERATAKTFNMMAGEIQRLVKSLKQIQQQQEEQLHFTNQLVDALPLPVFVRTLNGTCLTVNKAWEQLFETEAGDVVGHRLPSDFVPLADKCSRPERSTLKRSGAEVRVKAGAFDVREMAYFKAPFSNTKGTEAGTISALVDITERNLAQDALIAEKERAEVTLSSIGDGVITTNMAGQVESINEVARFLTGLTTEQAVGKRLEQVFRLDESSQSLPSGISVAQLSCIDTRMRASNQILLHAAGERYPIEFSAAPIRKQDGMSVGCVLVIRDVSHTRDLEQRITWQARHDPLTGLNNRLALSERLTHTIFHARQDGTLLGVCLLDLDNFHSVNESYGSVMGDMLLKELGLRLNDLSGDHANTARLGGDEFVLLLTGYRELSEIQAQVLQLLHRVTQPFAVGDKQISLTASVGVSIFPLDNANPDTLMRHADQAMCHAKQAGRNGFHFFDAQNDLEIQTQHSKLSRIAAAIERGELRLFYQPKVNLRSGRILGYEALMRWEHPERGLIGPGEFLPLIGHTDMIVDAGVWALQQAMAQLDQWVRQGHHWSIAVNIAARHFHRTGFVDGIRYLLACYPQVPPHLLELEILESAALDDVTHMRQVMQECQALGLKFSLDDFGTGFSSLSYLKQLPAETIKIDRSFVDGVLTDDEDRTLVSAIVGLSRAFARAVIAEGVETPDQAATLLALGCELGQGFGICRPMPASHVVGWAAQHSERFEPA